MIEHGKFVQYVSPALDGPRRRAFKDRRWAIADLTAVYRRRYQLQRTALEIFLVNGKNYFLEFANSEDRMAVLSEILKTKPPRLVAMCSDLHSKLLKKSKVTEKCNGIDFLFWFFDLVFFCLIWIFCSIWSDDPFFLISFCVVSSIPQCRATT
jgi:hypothetical protein